MFLFAFMHCALARIPVSSPQHHFKVLMLVQWLLTDGDRTQSIGRAIEPALWCTFHIVQRDKHAFFSLISDSHTCAKLHTMLIECQEKSAQVHQSDASGQSGSIAKDSRSTGYEPNLIQNQSRTHFAYYCGRRWWRCNENFKKILSSVELRLLQVLKIIFFKRHGWTSVQFAECPKSTLYMDKFLYNNIDIQTKLNSWCMTSESKLPCPAVPARAIRTCCWRASAGSVWTSWKCCSYYEPYSSADDFQIQRRWE